MIKTLLAGDKDKFDKDCNDFMRERKQNFPVRTSVVVSSDGSVIFHGTIFYDEDFAAQKPSYAPKPGPAPVEKKDGALWIQRDGTIKGYWCGKNVLLSEEEKNELLRTNTQIETEMFGDKVRIFRNQYKKTEKQPDFRVTEAK